MFFIIVWKSVFEVLGCSLRELTELRADVDLILLENESFFMMLVYFKNRNGQVTEINVVPQEIIKEDVKKVEELGGIE